MMTASIVEILGKAINSYAENIDSMITCIEKNRSWMRNTARNRQRVLDKIEIAQRSVRRYEAIMACYEEVMNECGFPTADVYIDIFETLKRRIA